MISEQFEILRRAGSWYDDGDRARDAADDIDDSRDWLVDCLIDGLMD